MIAILSSQKLKQKALHLNQVFFFRTVQEWNSLPSEIKEAPNKIAFRERLLEHTKSNTFKLDNLEME